MAANDYFYIMTEQKILKHMGAIEIPSFARKRMGICYDKL